MKKHAISGMEFLTVVIILFIIFIILIDLTLYFRQEYLLQAVNDEAFTKIETISDCSNKSSVKNILKSLSDTYFNINRNYTANDIGGGVTVYTAGRYSATLKCDNSNRTEGLSSSFLYDGIFIFKNKRLYSSYSSSVSYY